MVRFGFIIGCALMAAGAAVGFYGSPYYMLDWGGTLVISGVAMTACGLIVVMLAAVLRQVTAISERLAGAVPVTMPVQRADPPFEAAKPDAAPVADAAPDNPAAPPAAPAAAVGAVVAAGGLATAAASILSSVSHGAEAERDEARAPSPSPGRDDLFGKVEQAVRALKDEAGMAGATSGASETGVDEDFADLRADLRPAMAETDEAGSAPKAPEPEDMDEAAETAEIAVEDLPPPVAPAPPASEEGVVAAYTVGDSSYTMFADGRIRADTPEGELHFDNMDELKQHMARRRLGG